MADTSIPSFVVDKETKISISIPATDALSQDQGYTYNQATFTYNQPGVTYGGVYQLNQDISPSFFNDTADPETKIDLLIAKTNATLTDQGYTYNQPGFTYNQLGVDYGGVSQWNQDLAPQFFNDTASFITPSISGIVDRYIPKPTPSGNSGMLMGILGLTYP